MSAIKKHQFKEEKLRELILFICARSERDEYFSPAKLKMLLFLCDFIAFKARQKAITCTEYQKNDDAPMPRSFDALIAKMRRDGEFALQYRAILDETTVKPWALRDARLSEFEAVEIALVDEVVRCYRRRSARYIDMKLHDFIGWDAAKDGEVIPYFTAPYLRIN